MKRLVVKAMDDAIAKAYEGIAKEAGGPFGAAIISPQGDIVCVVHNRVIEDYDPTANAELTAIREACKKLKTLDLTGHIMIATGYPCPMCMAAIIWSNITKVYYGAPAEDCEVIGFRDEPMFRWFRGEESEIKLDIELCSQEHREQTMQMYLKYQEDEKQMY